MFFFFKKRNEDKVANQQMQLVDNYSTEELPHRYEKYLRIHGDNIVECERTLEILKKAYGGILTLLSSPIYKPKYALTFDKHTYVIELFSGHKRWGVDVIKVVQDQGGILHEGADSYVTELHDDKENILFALEYCSALPAGNNAWQRNGRALASVLAGIPYLYYAEIGGVELDKNRSIKAPRFPNPVVPFSYVSTSKRYKCCCVPVYKTHPTITEELYKRYKNIIGEVQGEEIIKGLIEGVDITPSLSVLIDKDLSLIKLLSEERRSIDTLRRDEWDLLLNSENPDNWLEDNTPTLRWKKKSANKVEVSDTFQDLISTVISYSCKTIGGKDLPICIVPKEIIGTLSKKLNTLYPDLNISLKDDKPLAIVWVTGFKPRGDDSRPDRGLVPLARMVLGSQANVMCVVSGRAKPYTWRKLKKSINDLCADNGLWLAVFHFCNYVLIDSVTIDKPKFITNSINICQNTKPVSFVKASNPVNFTEDDTDCAIHQIFAHKNDFGIFEGMCNPPGGDWSGISYFDNNTEYRWTSLPRVSKIGGKRPDHVIQIASEGIYTFFSIESKGVGRDLEDNIGNHLADYLRDLFSSTPTAQRATGGEWRRRKDTNTVLKNYRIVSVGAFMYNNDIELDIHRERGNLDAILAFELGNESIVHVVDKTDDKIVEKVLMQAKQVMTRFIIQVH